jgi:predicted DNA-binding transcriptional regulator AlpA
MQQHETTLAAESPIHNDLKELLKDIKEASSKPVPEKAMLRPAAASAFIGVSRTTLHRLSETDPTFPRKVIISARCVGYTRKSLTYWLDTKVGQI